MVNRQKFNLLVLTILCLLLAGCGGDDDGVLEAVEGSVTTISESPMRSPISPLPRPAITERFVLDEPIRAGDTAVSGRGPANVPIRIYEVANTADLLGELTTGADGQFSVIFPDRPLRTGERVGVTLGDLSGTPFNEDDFRDVAIREVPVYGYILADVSLSQ